MTDRMEHEMTDLDPAATVYVMDLDELTPHVAVYRHCPPMRESEERFVVLPRKDYDRLGKPTWLDVHFKSRWTM